MKILGGRLHLRAVGIALVAMLFSIWGFGLLASMADAQGGPDHSDLEHHHGFTGPGDVTNWPPRPTGASSDMVPAAGYVATEALSAAGDGPVVALSAEMAAALGTDWLHISWAPAKDGKDDYTPAEDTYFSRDLNQTVVVYAWPGGNEILTFTPDQLQPVIADSEEVEAAELGRTWLLEQGFADVESLEGFGIRALTDGDLYPVRMVYVTYATSWFDDPVYSALVDLTNGTVVEGGAL